MQPNSLGPPKALVIDDEPQMRRLLKLLLEAEGYTVRSADQGMPGLTEAALSRPDIVIVDLGLPDIPGLEVIRRLREWSDVPVLVLSVQTSQAEKVTALDTGADDYLSKPFDPSELFARLRVLRRRQQAEGSSAIVRFGTVEVDLNAHRVRKAGQEIELTPREFDFLSLLAKNRGKIITHHQLLKELWGPHCEDRTNYLRIYMGRLRKKLEDEPNQPKFLLTTSRLGYRLRPEDDQPEPLDVGADLGR
jgi:two-component system KDP operon response regulator KdpE